MKFDHASYFINIDGIDFHIGYDHRGTRIEFDCGTETLVIDKNTAEKVCNSMKKIVDLYIEKILK